MKFSRTDVGPLKILCFIILISTSFSCTEQEAFRPPNVLWITSEDNSKHYLKLFDENGVRTPNIERLAKGGLIFTKAFSNAPVCSVARSTLITGCYGPRIGAQYHRKYSGVPMPDSLKMFPYYLRKAGYYTSNNSKKDYNLVEGDSVWDESSNEASWRNRAVGQPFFHVKNIGISHEYTLHFSETDMASNPPQTDSTTFSVQPNHPNTATFRYTNAAYRDRILDMDRQVGEVLTELEKDGLLEHTIVFYFGDHGGVLPGSKGYLYETGLHVPLVVHIPEKFRDKVHFPKSGKVGKIVSFVDFAPTVLQLAGLEPPQQMDGKPFLTNAIDQEEAFTFSYADRMDEKYDMVRALRKGRYKYIRNFQPFNFDGLMNNYRYNQLAYKEWQELYEQGKLNNNQKQFFQVKEPEALFDIENDPFEITNLANDPEFASVLKVYRSELNAQLKRMPDLSFYPEFYLIENAFPNPTAFGQKHQDAISRYLSIANLSVQSFVEVRDQLKKHLSSDDPFDRYWALISCSSFADKAMELKEVIAKMANEDPELINRVRAAEFLGITKVFNPADVMLECLYQSKRPAEALLILNSMVLMQSYDHGYEFGLDFHKLKENVRQDKQVQRRLTFFEQVI